MKEVVTSTLEIRILDDGALRARRKDRKPLTDQDRSEARRAADHLPGIIVDDVLRVFDGGKVQINRVCQFCGTDEHARIVQRTWPDGKQDWMCHRCGRQCKIL